MQEPQRAATPRALVIGAAGSALLTASSLYIALRMGALPWPIVFAALVSVIALRAFGSKSLSEANVCHAAMSAGAMIAGGLAFTIPGLWILGVDDVNLPQIMLATLAGTILGLVASATLQPYFIREQKLAYPIGLSAADTLKACDGTGGKDSKTLFASMGLAGIYALLRDNLGLIPGIFSFGTVGAGVTLGIYNSPMILAVGFVVGVVPALVWFIGAVIGNLGIATLLPALGVINLEDAASIQSSAGLGLMLGVGAGAIIAGLAPVVRNLVKNRGVKKAADASSDRGRLNVNRPVVAICVCVAACIAAFALNLGLVASIIIVIGAWFCVYLSSWLTGTTGINPMEIFGVLVLLLIQVVTHESSLVSLFLAAAIIAVACGICGDCMNDLKAGDALQTNPRDQFTGEVVGAIVGAIVAPLMLFVLHSVYGSDAFGTGSYFVAAQASVVASMAGGIPFVAVFIACFILGLVMALLKLPVMTLGLGVYLPFYMSAAAGLGAVSRLVFNKLYKGKSPEDVAAKEQTWQAAASGILGGESLVGVITALVAVASLFGA